MKIPGSVGAAPIQNIGAYGAEVADFIEYVLVWDALGKSARYHATSVFLDIEAAYFSAILN